MQPQPDLVYRAFSSICETRTRTCAGYAKFRNFLLSGEQALAGKRALIDIFEDTLTLEYGEQPLSRYSFEWQEDSKHLLRVGNPQMTDHPEPSGHKCRCGRMAWWSGMLSFALIHLCDGAAAKVASS
jgi:hypothetical protein